MEQPFRQRKLRFVQITKNGLHERVPADGTDPASAAVFVCSKFQLDAAAHPAQKSFAETLLIGFGWPAPGKLCGELLIKMLFLCKPVGPVNTGQRGAVVAVIV